jgi:hypothetical protein
MLTSPPQGLVWAGHRAYRPGTNGQVLSVSTIEWVSPAWHPEPFLIAEPTGPVLRMVSEKYPVVKATVSFGNFSVDIFGVEIGIGFGNTSGEELSGDLFAVYEKRYTHVQHFRASEGYYARYHRYEDGRLFEQDCVVITGPPVQEGYVNLDWPRAHYYERELVVNLGLVGEIWRRIWSPEPLDWHLEQDR